MTKINDFERVLLTAHQAVMTKQLEEAKQSMAGLLMAKESASPIAAEILNGIWSWWFEEAKRVTDELDRVKGLLAATPTH